jgi:hypothetical protein
MEGGNGNKNTTQMKGGNVTRTQHGRQMKM